jgi:hypothetical protein
MQTQQRLVFVLVCRPGLKDAGVPKAASGRGFGRSTATADLQIWWTTGSRSGYVKQSSCFVRFCSLTFFVSAFPNLTEKRCVEGQLSLVAKT